MTKQFHHMPLALSNWDRLPHPPVTPIGMEIHHMMNLEVGTIVPMIC